MRFQIITIALLAALTLVVGSCKSDEELQPPTPAYLTEGTASRPTWTVPVKSYEFYMTVQVQLGDTLANFQSVGDLMCAIIDGEVRTATGPANTAGVVYFPLTIGSNDTSGTVTLQYYCERLHRIYSITNWATFDPSAKPIGEDGIYRPCFTEIDK